MTQAFLLGFSYSKTNTYIPGIVVDLYRMYRFCQKKNMEITIITDISKDEKFELLKEAIIYSIVDQQVEHFISENINKCLFVCKDAASITETVEKRLKDNHVFFYYTGHGINGEFLLPKKQTLSTQSLLSLITTKLKPTKEIMFVVDCCDANFIEWKYVYTRDKFEKKDTSSEYKHLIIYLRPISNRPEISAKGSSFSCDLLNAWRVKRYTWELIDGVVSASFLPGRTIPKWLMNEKVEVTPWSVNLRLW